MEYPVPCQNGLSNKIQVVKISTSITACTVVLCSVMDDSAFLWEHAIFGPRPTVTP
jgi:hypothetical protein